MTDLDEQIDARLRAAGTEFRQRPVPGVDVRWPVARRQHRWAVPLAAAAAVCAVVAGVAVAIAASRDAGRPPQLPATPAPVTNRSYAVGLPPFFLGLGGPALQMYPACARGLVAASETTVGAVDGVVGVLSLAAQQCSLTPDAKSIALLDAKGRRLAVKTSAGNPVNAAAALRSDTPGSLRVGFAWTGSWCGPRPAFVEIAVRGEAVRARYTGPVPACRKESSGKLVPGIVGYADTPVEPAPVAWQALRAQVVVPTTRAGGKLVVAVTLTNPTRDDISLASPCPTYAMTVSYESSGSEVGGGGDFCDRALVVKAGGSITLRPAVPADSPVRALAAGDHIIVTWSMAGVAPPPPVTVIVH